MFFAMPTNNYVISKLQKNGKIEYPVTRPECVMYPDNTTVYDKIETLMNGASIVWGVYDNGLHEQHINTPHMFKDSGVLMRYFSIMMDNAIGSIYSIEVNGSNNDIYSWSFDNLMESGCYVVEKEGDERVPFNMKHFMWLMNGKVPVRVVTDVYEGNDGKVYNNLEYFGNDYLEVFQDDYSFKCIRLTMTPSEPFDDNDKINLYFIPSYNHGVTYSVNPMIVNMNEQ